MASACFVPLGDRHSLLGLPLDTMLHILSFLGPRDILFARRTCRQLCIASCQRIVWINALKDLCFQQRIFPHTFPIRDMSLAQLEHAATTPTRFTNLLHTCRSDEPIPPVATRIVKPRSPRGFEGDSRRFESLYLVPGGRFLLTRSSQNLLQVWDLGFRPDMLINPESLAMHHLGTSELQFDPDAQITLDGQGLLVFLASENIFRIFRVYPLAPSPSFELVASIDVILGGRCVYIFTAELIVYFMGHCVTVWNYIEDTTVRWSVRSSRIWDIAVSDNLVIILDHHGFSLYRIPPLHPRAATIDVQAQTPLACVPYPLTSVVKVADNWSWYTSISKDRPIHFDILGVDEGEEDETLGVARYTLKVVDNQPEDGLPSYFPVPVEKVKLDMLLHASTDSARSIRTGSNDMLLMWPSLSGKKLFALLSNMDEVKPMNTWQTPRISSLEISPICNGEVTCCPFSGRVCTIDINGSIHVMDFVMPPTSSNLYELGDHPNIRCI